MFVAYNARCGGDGVSSQSFSMNEIGAPEHGIIHGVSVSRGDEGGRRKREGCRGGSTIRSVDPCARRA